MWEKIVHLWLKFKKPEHGLGLRLDKPDERDFKTEQLGWSFFATPYKPKNDKIFIPPVSVKNQFTKNTCQWNATIARKERDEGCKLSVRAFVAYAVKKGMCGDLGLSGMRDGEKILEKWGCPDEEYCNRLGIYETRSDGTEIPWKEYINIDTDRLTANANTHKSKSYWSVSSIDDALKLLDSGRAIKVAMPWYTGMNISGGFSFPWIIQKLIGYLVGYHCIVCDGFDMNKNSFRCLKLQNSYGNGWGEVGHFWITIDLMEKYIREFGAWTDLDIVYDKVSAQEIMEKYNGQNVKGTKPEIFFVFDGYKYHYPDWITYVAYGYDNKDFVVVPQEALDAIPAGAPMSIKLAPTWKQFQSLKDPENLKKLLEYLNKFGIKKQ